MSPLGGIKRDATVETHDEGKVTAKRVLRLVLVLGRKAREEFFDCNARLVHPEEDTHSPSALKGEVSAGCRAGRLWRLPLDHGVSTLCFMTLQLQQAMAFQRNLPEDLWFAVEGCGISAALIHARLIGWDGECVTIPIFSRDRKVLGFEYAAFDDGGRLVVLPQERQRPYLYGEPVLNLSPSEVVLTEGVVESLVLSSRGFNALSATGDGLSFREEWAAALRKVRDVFICFKRHAESIGSALIVRDLVPQARIVTLPPEVGHGGGLYEFFVELGQSPADFRTLLRRAADSPDA